LTAQALFVLFLYLKEKGRKRSKQTCSLIACFGFDTYTTLRIRLFTAG
jgi:hypothetical protein